MGPSKHVIILVNGYLNKRINEKKTAESFSSFFGIAGAELENKSLEEKKYLDQSKTRKWKKEIFLWRK